MRLLLIDDDAELCSMLVEYLAGEGFETDVVHTGEDGIAAALSGRYAAVILDIMLPRGSGIDVLRRLRPASRVPIIMLTARGDDVDRVIGLEMGADDYLPKPCYPRELVARLRAVLRRSGELSSVNSAATPLPLRLGSLRLDPARRQVECDERRVDLTATEFNLLEILLRAGDNVVSKDELSLRVLGRAREPYDRSIDVHVSNLRQKLTAAGLSEAAIETVRGFGYRAGTA